jgi:dihydroorotate dehydrogenase (NAD+) catalytic subunit
MSTVDMSTKLSSFELPYPVLTASGCAASGKELSQFFDLNDIGAVVTKSIMMQARSGRPTPRMVETPSGMLNSIGLQGPGIDSFLANDLPWLRDRGVRTVVSIAGGSTDEFVNLTKRLYDKKVDLIEVNISCPNVENRGQVFACDPLASSRVISAVKRAAHPNTPIFAKLSPDVTDIGFIARAVAEAGADGISLINTTLGLSINLDTLQPALGGITGGLSGPAIRPIAVRAVWQVHKAVPHLPLLGMGGIKTGRDALEFILAGASAVSVGTTVFHDPSAPVRIIRELEAELARCGFASLRDAIGFAHYSPDVQATLRATGRTAEPAPASDESDQEVPA